MRICDGIRRETIWGKEWARRRCVQEGLWGVGTIKAHLDLYTDVTLKPIHGLVQEYKSVIGAEEVA